MAKAVIVRTRGNNVRTKKAVRIHTHLTECPGRDSNTGTYAYTQPQLMPRERKTEKKISGTQETCVYTQPRHREVRQ